MTEEQKKISKPTYANRFHFLSWEQRLTPTILEKSNIKVDCTLGFAEHYGYRNGICHPFNLYDLKQDKMLEILEYPLHVMDTTFEQEKYLNSGNSEVPSVFRRLHAEAKKFNGFTSVLWHNNFLSPYKYSGWREVYEEILEHAEEEAALFIEPNFAIPL